MTKETTTVFVSGNFFALHPGHVRLLKFAAECGDFLVVGVSALQPSKDVPPPHERAEALRELGLVNRVIILENGVEAYLRELRPDVVVKGKEYEDRHNPEAAILRDYGGRIVFSSGESTYSAADLLAQDNKAASRLQLNIPADYLRRHNLTTEKLAQSVANFKKLSVAVIGDLIVDEYIMCEALGMSREDPTLVVSPQSTDRFIGGAGIVAAHAAALGATVRFFSVIGDDAVGQDAAKRLADYKVEATLAVDDSRPTTLKQRYRAQEKTMLRVSHLRQHEISLELQDRMASAFEEICKSTQLVIFSDFNYGCLPQRLVDRMTATAQKNGVLIAADSQSSSQIGDISRFRNSALMTPTEHEARLALRDQTSGLAALGFNLLAKTASDRAFITLGAAGVLVITADAAQPEHQTDRLPALNPHPRDVSGAGDSMLTAGAMALATGASTWEAALIGSIAAAIQTARVGNRPISSDEFLTFLRP
jgi:rfaE bifunctional protein kinase chain/domain